MDRLWPLAMIQETSDVVLHSYLILRTLVKHIPVPKSTPQISKEMKIMREFETIVSCKTLSMQGLLD
jgi:hypothetical protein